MWHFDYVANMRAAVRCCMRVSLRLLWLDIWCSLFDYWCRDSAPYVCVVYSYTHSTTTRTIFMVHASVVLKKNLNLV